MDNQNQLSSESSVEEVINFFVTKFQINEKIQNNLKKESITGDVLPLLTDEELKNPLGLKFGPIKSWKLYFKDNADKFKPKEIKEKITTKSSEEEVKSFFERCLDFKGALNGMNGKQLIALKEEEMKKIGLNLGKRKKLLEYIKHFETLVKTENAEEDEKIAINRQSSFKDVANF